MASIERYETGMAWVRDGVWVVAVLCAFFGLLHFAEALILGGVAWFGLALLRKAPRLVGRYRPFLASRWRTINRILLGEVVVFALIGELVRTGRLAEPAAAFWFVLSLVLCGVWVLKLWRSYDARSPHPQPPLP